MTDNLGQFLKTLQTEGEIQVVDKPVSPVLEISRLTDIESKKPNGGKALYFSRVSGSAFPVATNIFGSPKRICMALGVDHLDDLAGRVRQYLEFNPPKNLKEAVNALPLAISLARFVPRPWRRGRPPCQEVVLKGGQVDLTRLPVLTCWPKDAGPFVTLPLVITRSLATGRRNMGMYRLQIFDEKTTGMHWHIHKDGSHFHSEYLQAGKTMPVAVAIGADPATTYAATAPLPRGVDEMLLAGFIRNRPVRMAKCITCDLEVPAEAEFVLEGFVRPGELRREGPFGDHTGYYSLADDYPVFHVTAITHRKSPVYSATLVGPPPMEDCYLAKATERLFLPMLQAVMPEIRDYWFPWEGVFHNIVIVAIDKAYAGHAQKIISGLWGQGQMSFCKAIVVVDGDVAPGDPGQVLEALLGRFDPTTDLTLTRGVLDVLDHSSPHPTFGSKIGIDLTRRHAGEPPRRLPSPPKSRPRWQGVAEAARQQLPAFRSLRPLLAELAETAPATNTVVAVTAEKGPETSGRKLAEALLDLEALSAWNIVLLFDAAIDLDNASLMLWKVFNNVDPGRDLIIRGRRVVVDACVKGPADGHDRQWPEELTFDT